MSLRLRGCVLALALALAAPAYAQIDTAIKDIIDRAFERAHRILTRNRDALRHAATTLLEKETLVEADLAAVFGSIALPADEHEDMRGAA